MAEEHKTPGRQEKMDSLTSKRRVLLRGAGFAGAGFLGIGTTSTKIVSANSSTKFVGTTYDHTVDFGEDSNVSRSHSLYAITIFPDYFIKASGDILLISEFVDKEKRDYIKNSDQLLKVNIGPFQRFPVEDSGSPTMPRVITQLVAGHRPVKHLRPISQYKSPRFDVSQDNNSSILVETKEDSYRVKEGTTKRIPFETRSMQFHVTTKDGSNKEKTADVTPELVVSNHGTMQIEEAQRNQ